MKLSLGFSPCPNDTFIFDAMVNGKIDTEDLEFDFFWQMLKNLTGGSLQRNQIFQKSAAMHMPMQQIIILYWIPAVQWDMAVVLC